MHPRDKRIPIEQCEDRKVYRVWARNIKIGVYLKWRYKDEDLFAFFGIREKFGDRFIDVEYHWDAPAYPTCCPMEVIDTLPDGIEINCLYDNKELFDWLDAKEQEIGLTTETWGKWKTKLFEDELKERVRKAHEQNPTNGSGTDSTEE